MTHDPVILLGPGELLTAATIAAMRQSVNRHAGTHNLKAGPQDVMTTEIVGTLGEIAFATYGNVMVDLTTHLRRGSFDASWRGWSVDVKATRNQKGDLYVDARPDKRPDLYVLVHVEYCRCQILGWIATHDIPNRDHTPTQYGLRLPQSALSTPDRLWHIRPAQTHLTSRNA